MWRKGNPPTLLVEHHSLKALILQCSSFFTVQLSRPYMTTGKTIAFTTWTFVDKVMSLLFNMLSRLVIWRRKCQPTPVFLPGKSYRQRGLAGYSPWGHERVRCDLSTKQQQHPSHEVNMVENIETLIRIEEVKHRPS